ncbi:hypothetical protein SAMN05428945_2208 [Streptomyces sp. 2224.1]|uniref:DUF6251 family protein n=1 Tax=Streptomyces sp. 2224.1 TaxID=1881020 RepID=UPI00089B17DF|nr:DUF6251 family protein [Streptomyces sp. 2224.1]SEC16623.1 hypothetical protein SAMN05428945_2208 [Streptomyces sp. 2224.1]
MTPPRRYQFDNQLPVPRNPDQQLVYRPEPLNTAAAYEQPPVVVQHIHQAPPDRTVQRIALGVGAGGGAVAAGVYFGPLLVGSLTAIAADLAILALLAAVGTWGVVTVVRSIGGPDGKAAAENLSKARRNRR